MPLDVVFSCGQQSEMCGVGGVECVAFPHSFKFAGMFESWSKATMLQESWQQFCRKNNWSIAQNTPPPKKVSRHTTVSKLVVVAQPRNLLMFCSLFAVIARVNFDIFEDTRMLDKYLGIFVDYTFLHERMCTKN